MMEEEGLDESDSDDEIQKNLARKRNPQPSSGSPDVWKDTSGVLNLSYPGPCLPHPQVSSHLLPFISTYFMLYLFNLKDY